MKKKHIIRILILFFTFFPFVNAYAVTTTLTEGARINYENFFTSYFYTSDRTSSNTYNAFCLEPKEFSPNDGTYTATEVTENDTYEDLVRGIYYLYGAPGWTNSIASSFDNNFCDGNCTNALYYAYSHIILSYYYNSIKSNNGWNTGVSASTQTKARNWANKIEDYDDPPAGFRVFIIKNNNQDILYWTYEEEEDVCAKVTKRNALPKAGTDNTYGPKVPGVKIGLYTKSGSTYSLVTTKTTTKSAGQVTFKNLDPDTTYYIKETETVDGFENNNGTYRQISTSTNCTNTTILDYPKFYCLKVMKVDAESTSKVLNGAKFSVNIGGTNYTGTTPEVRHYNHDRQATSNTSREPGYFIVDMIPESEKGSYSFTETNSNGDILTDTSGNSYRYWKTVGTTSSKQVSEMVRNGDSYTCPSGANTVTAANNKQYACLKVKKTDKATGTALSGATFTLDGGSSKTSDSNGIATWFLGEVGTEDLSTKTYTVKETSAPQGYALPSPDTKSVKAFLLSANQTRAEAQAECLGTTKNSNANSYNFQDSKLLINWYKSYESTSNKANNATFKVKNSSGNYIVTSGTESVTDANGTTKTCYKYSTTNSTGSAFTAGANGETGGVCISGIPNGTYTVIETSPAPNHTFGNSLTKNITASTTYNTNQVFTNTGTYVEVGKDVTDADRVSNSLDDSVLYKIETNKLKKIPFEVYKTDGNGNPTGDPISFVLRDGIYYDLSSPDITLASGENATTSVYLNNDRKFKLSHLAWGSYVVKEKGNKNGECDCENDADCIGYYQPTSSQEVKFTITKCSSSTSVSSSTANSSIGSNTCSVAYTVSGGTQDNTPTELWFTKKDFYGYEDSSDVVDFENDEERNDFDKIKFKVYTLDSNGNKTYLQFIRIGNHVTDSSNACLNDNDYSEYRYITNAELSLLTIDEIRQLQLVDEITTCGGHIRLTNLCRGKTYYVEEVEVPENSVFVLQKDENGNNPTTSYTIPCCDDTTTTSKTSKTIIDDKGTRVRFEKRDSKYNYLIPDETTTFEVYRCPKTTNTTGTSTYTECNPGLYSTVAEREAAGMKLMKFAPRKILTGDEEDGGVDDYESTYEVYTAMSDSDAQGKTACTTNGQSNCYVTDLHPDKGILVLRYLKSGYNYVLLETVSPKGYMLPSGTNAETKFTVTNTTVDVEEVNVPNKPVSLLVRKYAQDGELLGGAEFTISKATSCNFNIAPNKVPTEGVLKLKTIRDGVYEVRDVGDTNIFKTCQDRTGYLCNDINNTLTHSSYDSTVGDFSRLLNSRNEAVEIEAGEALIQYLDYDSCYIIEETKAPTGYSLPEKEEDRFVMVKITNNEQIVDTFEELVNKPTPYTFYKYDEYNKPLDGGKYKLQKLNEDKVYKDVAVTKMTSETGISLYKVDKDSENYLIDTKDGSATIYYLEEGQYRILEVEAPAGYELPVKTVNVATFFVDSNGSVYGSNIIANKPKTTTYETKPSASSKLIVNIQTGQKVIRYGLIIVILILTIGGLMYIPRKVNKENKKNEKGNK